MHCVRKLAFLAIAVVAPMLAAWAGGTVSAIDGVQMRTMIAAGATVIDVRRADEWRTTGIVPGATLITAFDVLGRPNPRFVDEVRAASGNREPIILICRSGNRSMKAGEALVGEGGYRSVFSVNGGMNEWIAAGAPVQPCPSC